MTKFFEEIKSKINNKFYPEKLELIDNSYLHTTHKSFDPKKIHLKISGYLNWSDPEIINIINCFLGY